MRTRWVNLHPLVRVLAVLCLLALVAFPTARPGYRALKQWRMERNLAAAERAVDAERMHEARDLSISVLRAGDPGIAALRILERSAAALGDTRHPDIAHALIAHPEGTAADRLAGFQGVVMDLPLGRLGQIWTSIPEESRTRPEFATAFARRLIAEGRLGEAVSVLLDVPETSRDAATRQELARSLIASGRNEGFEEAQRMIAAGMSVDCAAAAAAWLDVLEDIPTNRLRPALLSAVRGALDAMSTGTAERGGIETSRLELLRSRLALARPGTVRDRVLADAVGKWRDVATKPLAQLLHDFGEDDLLLETFPPPETPAGPDLVRLLWRAALRQSAWDVARVWLNAHGACLPAYEMMAYRAILAAKSEDQTASQLAWKGALEAAGQAPTGHALLSLHRVAKDAGFEDAAASAMVEAIRTGSGPLPLYETQQELIRSLAAAGRETQILEICAVYLTLEPSNPVLLTQYAYLACVHEIVEPAQLLPPLEALAAAFPDELQIHTTLATALLADGRAGDADRVLAPFQLADRELAPGLRIVHLANEVLNGRIADDDAQITSFPWASLQNAERRKFGGLLRR